MIIKSSITFYFIFEVVSSRIWIYKHKNVAGIKSKNNVKKTL